MESILREKDGRLRISYFQQFAKIFPDEIHNIVAIFPILYALYKKTRELTFYRKRVYPDSKLGQAVNAKTKYEDILS